MKAKVKVIVKGKVVFEGEGDSYSLHLPVEEVGGTLVPQEHLRSVTVQTDTHEVIVRPATKVVEKAAKTDSSS